MFKRFLGEWESIEDLINDFGGKSIGSYEIIVAGYFYGSWEGGAYVLAYKDGKLWEVEGGHCSCYGLETQWEPGEVSVKYLKNRLEKGKFSYFDDKDSIREQIRLFLEYESRHDLLNLRGGRG